MIGRETKKSRRKGMARDREGRSYKVRLDEPRAEDNINYNLFNT